MWTGDVREILRIIYKFYFQSHYIGNLHRQEGHNYYNNVMKRFESRIYDIEEGYLVTKRELLIGIPEFISNKFLKQLHSEIEKLHWHNEARANSLDDEEFIPVASAIFITDKNWNITGIFRGENKEDYNDKLKEFKLKWFGEYPHNLHAEIDALYKVYDKLKYYDNQEYRMTILTVRNGHNVFSRPCVFCRRAIHKINKELKFGEIYLVYPVIEDLVMIEKFHKPPTTDPFKHNHISR